MNKMKINNKKMKKFYKMGERIKNKSFSNVNDSKRNFSSYLSTYLS